MLNIKKIMSALVLGLMVFSFSAALATPVSAVTGFGLDEFAAGADLTDGSTAEGGLQGTIGRLLKIVLGFLGVIAVCIILVGGFKYMISGGEEKKAKDARSWIVAGIIGLAIILAAYTITFFVFEQLQKAITNT